MIRFVLPVLALGFFQQLFNALDVILAGQLGESGSDAVAAVGSTNALRSFMVNFFMGCSTGSAVTVSHAIGAGNKKEIRETVHTAMLLSVLLGAVLTLLGVAFSGAFLALMETPQNIFGKATVYLQSYFLTMISSMIYNFGAAILRANGETKKPLYFYLITAPIKLVLTYLFVSVFGLDLVGLSLSTVVSQSIAAVLVVIELIKTNSDIKLSLKKLRFHVRSLKKILYLGIPSGIQSSTYSLSSVVIQSSVNSLAFLPGFITGNSAAYSIETFAEIVTGAFYQAAMTFVGVSVGAKDYVKVKKSYKIALLLCTVTIALLSSVVILFAKPLLRLYIPDSETAVSWGVVRIIFIFGPLFMQGFMDCTTGTLRGLGVSISNTVISIVGVCGVRILWCLTVFRLPACHNPQMLYSIYPITWTLITALQLVVFLIVYNRQKRKYEVQPTVEN